MGTRAVVHLSMEGTSVGKDIWIATHWDGYPEQLGKDLAELGRKLKTAERPDDMLQTDGVAVTAKRHIDEMTTDGETEFNRRYSDWAEWFYEVTPDGKVKVVELSGSWGGKPKKAPRDVSLYLKKKKLDKVI